MDVPAAFLSTANPYEHVVILDEVTTMYSLERKKWKVESQVNAETIWYQNGPESCGMN